MTHDYDTTRRSWNVATRNHNAHKGDQAAFFRGGGDTLFSDELELLGPLDEKRLVHLQCNAGQDTLSLARRGARATGVDLSDEAIAFARRLARDTGIAATFVEAEVVTWLETTDERFDLAFASYGATGWLPDLDRWARGVARVLVPGGRLVYVESHPLVWSFDEQLALAADDYFAEKVFLDPVHDYVATAGAALGAVAVVETEPNLVPATSWQHGMGKVLDAVARAGLVLERVVEYPYSNGCRLHRKLVPHPTDPRRWVWPEGMARVPLMYGLAARR